MQNLHPAIAEALRPFAPAPAVRSEFRQQGSGGVITFRGADFEAVYNAALDRKNSIDIYRSPAISAQYLHDSDEYVVEVRYYGLD
ncbi:hypothetical protein [Cupriavidus gilardii]|uniref:hypothetical protein n=1 Tax=Cupriavidus gilardii TaxID=82541 RepID=UPI0021BF4F43|nr:hypothetical protein [Cupriavidus gilardii]MCT9125380.1 hypothetical protein [Cupriavidus gilardii]